MKKAAALLWPLNYTLAQADDSFCTLGWPAILGPASRQGKTSVTIWAQSPNDDYYFIGGTSDSVDFTEEDSCQRENGCAFMAQWNRISQEFEQKWVFSQYTDLVDIKFEPFESQAGDITFATVMVD